MQCSQLPPRYFVSIRWPPCKKNFFGFSQKGSGCEAWEPWQCLHRHITITININIIRLLNLPNSILLPLSGAPIFRIRFRTFSRNYRSLGRITTKVASIFWKISNCFHPRVYQKMVTVESYQKDIGVPTGNRYGGEQTKCKGEEVPETKGKCHSKYHYRRKEQLEILLYLLWWLGEDPPQ